MAQRLIIRTSSGEVNRFPIHPASAESEFTKLAGLLKTTPPIGVYNPPGEPQTAIPLRAIEYVALKED